jgi:hypothetical protein
MSADNLSAIYLADHWLSLRLLRLLFVHLGKRTAWPVCIDISLFLNEINMVPTPVRIFRKSGCRRDLAVYITLLKGRVSRFFYFRFFMNQISYRPLVSLFSKFCINLGDIRNFRSLACLLTRGASNCSPVSVITLKNWSPVTLTPPMGVTTIEYQAVCSQ